MTTIVQFKNKFSKKPSSLDSGLDGASFNQIVSAWKHTVIADKEAAAVFTMCNYGEKADRTRANILSVTGIVLDVDDGNTVEQVMAALERLSPYAHCWYTTYSHTEENPRVRVVVPITTPVTADVFDDHMLALRLANWLNLTIDDCSRKPTQFYFLPSKPAASTDSHIYVGQSTTLFDISVLPAKPAKPSKNRSGDAPNTSDQLAVFNKIDSLVASLFDNIQPLYVGDKFYIYSCGVWHAVNPGRTFYKELIEYHDRKIGIAEATELVAAMKTMFSVDAFPGSAINKITLTNGTFDTDTGEFETHSPENYHRTGMAFDYDPTATCDLWLKTLDGIFFFDLDKEQKIQLLQEWTGYLLTPIIKYQVMLWLYGGGQNGKSVITHIIRWLLGIENVSAIPLTQLSGTFIGAELDGKLANIVDEIATNALMQEDEIKKIVSGDPLLVQRKQKDPYFLYPTARIMVTTNTLPPSKDSTYGLDRRLMLLTFNRTFTMDEIDRDLGEKLKAELPGIFVWALAGHMRLKAQDKFTEAPSSVAAMEEFKACRNSASLFKRDCIELPRTNLALVGGNDKAFRIPSQELYETYKTYCRTNMYQPFGKEGFGKKLKELGVEQIRTGGKRYYVAKTVNLDEAGLNDDRYSGPTRASIQDAFADLPDVA